MKRISSPLAVLLFFMSNLNVFGNYELAFPDTIILDGKLIEVNRSVEYDTIPSTDPKLPNVPSSSRWCLGVGAYGGPNFNRVISSTAGLSSIDEFRGRSLRVASDLSFYAHAGHFWTPGFYMRSGVGVDLVTIRNDYFSESSLDDSLFRFDTQGEVIRQILRFRYDIGTETDTLSLSLIESSISLNYLQVPLIAGMTWESPNNTMRWVAEFGLVYSRLSGSTGGPVVLLNEEAEYIYHSVEEINLRDNSIQAHLAFGVSTNLGRNKRSVLWNPEFFALAATRPRMMSVNDKSSGVQVTSWSMGFDVGLRFFLKKKIR